MRSADRIHLHEADVRDIHSGPPQPRPTLLERFCERKIVQWTVAYLAFAWLILQLTECLSDIWGWSVLFQQAVSLLLGFGVLPALVIAWFHGEQGRQEICPTEAAIVAASIMSSVFVVWSFCLGSV